MYPWYKFETYFIVIEYIITRNDSNYLTLSEAEVIKYCAYIVYFFCGKSTNIEKKIQKNESQIIENDAVNWGEEVGV